PAARAPARAAARRQRRAGAHVDVLGEGEAAVGMEWCGSEGCRGLTLSVRADPSIPHPNRFLLCALCASVPSVSRATFHRHATMPYTASSTGSFKHRGHRGTEGTETFRDFSSRSVGGAGTPHGRRLPASLQKLGPRPVKACDE